MQGRQDLEDEDYKGFVEALEQCGQVGERAEVWYRGL